MKWDLLGGIMFPLTEPTYLILLGLREEPLHGYGIIKLIFDVSDQNYDIPPGTLYGVLKNLEKSHYIQVVGSQLDNRKKKIYAITDLGKKVLDMEQRRYENLLKITYRLRGNEREDL